MSDSFVFPSASNIDKEFFGGSYSNNVNQEDDKDYFSRWIGPRV